MSSPASLYPSYDETLLSLHPFTLVCECDEFCMQLFQTSCTEASHRLFSHASVMYKLMRHRCVDDSAVVPEAQQTIRRVDQLIRRSSVTAEYFFEHNPQVSCKKHISAPRPSKALKNAFFVVGVMIRARKGDTKRVSGGQRHRTHVCGYNKVHRGCLQRLRAKRAESMGREGKAQFSWPAAVEE